uniref:FAD-binding FR-type domain-containing protein n=1 Tax=Arcella intermedia TaxID=1963864 RepID=A0A6B2L207_9EUKA
MDCGLVLIAVLRNFLSWVRGTWVGTYLPIDKNINFHKWLAWAVAFFTTLHSVAHFVNVYNMAYVTPAATLIQLGLLKQGGIPKNPWEWAFTTIPGATGVFTCVVMFIMWTTAVESVRRPMFEAFWYTHHLWVVFYLLQCVHGIAGLLEQPMFWMYTIGPMLFYIIERIIRIVRGSQKTIIIEAIQHPSRVLEIRMKKATFNYSPGQYIFLQCSYIADFEWHPFTISSSPDDDYMSVHIRIVGDWTGKMYNLLNPEKKSGLVQENLLSAPNGKPILEVDGPYGTASEDVWQFETVMLIAAGIGSTPFASILKSIKYKIENEGCQLKLVQFYWTNRDLQSFEWFVDLLAQLEKTCPFLEIYLYFTGDLSADQVRAYMMNTVTPDDDGEVDLVTGLHSRTTYGRPNINSIFEEQSQRFAGKTVGVFFCGPHTMGREIRKCCEKSTDVVHDTRFIYHKENF